MNFSHGFRGRPTNNSDGCLCRVSTFRNQQLLHRNLRIVYPLFCSDSVRLPLNDHPWFLPLFFLLHWQLCIFPTWDVHSLRPELVILLKQHTHSNWTLVPFSSLCGTEWSMPVHIHILDYLDYCWLLMNQARGERHAIVGGDGQTCEHQQSEGSSSWFSTLHMVQLKYNNAEKSREREIWWLRFFPSVWLVPRRQGTFPDHMSLHGHNNACLISRLILSRLITSYRRIVNH
jgi:hypothetical protein